MDSDDDRIPAQLPGKAHMPITVGALANIAIYTFESRIFTLSQQL